MAFEGLSEKLNAAFKRLRGKGRLTENDVREAMREVRLALLEADVSRRSTRSRQPLSGASSPGFCWDTASGRSPPT